MFEKVFNVIKLIKILLNINLIKNKIIVKRPIDTVVVQIMYNRNNGKYHFVNLTNPHICACAFDSIEDAIADLEKFKSEGKVIEYEILKNG